MSRLSREKKREQKPAGHPAAVVAPLDVHVRGGGSATIGGVPVVAVEGEEIQRAVLSHLHRIALATGHPVRATVHDERIGYVVALRVDTDGSSHFTAEPLRAPATPPEAPEGAAPDAQRRAPTGVPSSARVPDTAAAPAAVPTAAPTVPTAVSASADTRPRADTAAPADTPAAADVPTPGDAVAAASAAFGPVHDEHSAQPLRDMATHIMRPLPEPVRDSAPTFPLRAVPEPEAEREARPAPTYAGGAPAPGTVAAPTGVFGPPPTMDGRPSPDATMTPTPTPTPTPTSTSTPDSNPSPAPMSTSRTPAPASIPAPIPIPLPLPASASDLASATPVATSSPTPFLPDSLISESAFDPDPGFKPTPARGFDAVAEAVLGDDPRTLHGDGGAPALLAEPIAQINEAVRAGRTEAATDLAERTVLEASGTLGPEHPEVLGLRELGAYIAYLAGDPLRAFHVSLDLARIRRRARDAEAAYGNVQSAAAAWRAVRDPLQGLNLGTELLVLWTELTTEEGPAADDVEELESARARMLRLAERARKAGA